MLEARLARARADLDLGAFALGLAEMQAIAAEAHALGYPTFEARALYTLGRAQHSLGHYDAQRTALLAAVASAEVARDDRSKATARGELVYVTGWSLYRPAEGHEHARQTEAALARLGGDERIEGDLRVSEGQIFLDEKRLPEALAKADRGVELLGRAAGKDSRAYATSLPARGKVRSAMGRLDDALADYRAALAIHQAVLGPDHPQVSIALQLIATILYMRGDLVGSRAGFERVLAIREGALGPDHPELAITVNNLASVAYEDHRWEDALRYYRRVLAIREKVLGPEDARLVDPLTGIGGTLVELYRPAEAVPALERALVIATAASTPPADLADARFQLARALWRSGGDRRRAVELATEAGATTDNDTLRAQTAAWLSRPQ